MTSNVSTMNDDSIADYLRQHPEFFERHAELLSTVQLSSGHGGRAVSLQERQAEMLRDKIKGMEQRIMEMVRNSSDNASIAHKIHRWSCALAKVQDPRQLPHTVSEGIQREFEVPQVAGVQPAARQGGDADHLAALPLRAGTTTAAARRRHGRPL